MTWGVKSWECCMSLSDDSDWIREFIQDCIRIYSSCIVQTKIRRRIGKLAGIFEKDFPTLKKNAWSNDRRSFMSWSESAAIIVFWLHPFGGNLNSENTCLIFNVNLAKFSNWIIQNSFCGKWIAIVSPYTFKNVVKYISEGLGRRFSHDSVDSSVTTSHCIY